MGSGPDRLGPGPVQGSNVDNIKFIFLLINFIRLDVDYSNPFLYLSVGRAYPPCL